MLNETLQLPPSVLCAGGLNHTFKDADALRNVGPAGRIVTASGHTAKQYTPVTNHSISRNDWLCSDSVRYHKADSDSAVKAPLHASQIRVRDASQDSTRVRWRYHRGWRQIAPGTAVTVPFVTNPRFSTPNVRRRVTFAYIIMECNHRSDLNAGT